MTPLSRLFRRQHARRRPTPRQGAPGLSREAVVLAFEMLLGRRPHDDADMDYHLNLNFPDIQALAEYLIRTDEFAARYGAIRRPGALLRRPSEAVAADTRPAPVFLGDRVLAWTHWGQRIYLLPDDLDLTPRILLDGTWEPHVERTIRRLARAGDTAVDLGANIGFHTLMLGAMVGPGGRVFAFEPHPEVMRLLRATILVNGFRDFVILNACAMLDRAGTITLASTPGRYGSGNLVPDAFAPAYNEEYTTRIDVPATTLDTLLADEVDKIDLIHMDIEGSEPLALHGAERLLDRSPGVKIITEWSVHMMAGRTDLGVYIAWLSELGFRFWLIERETAHLTPLDPLSLMELPHCDLLLSRADPS